MTSALKSFDTVAGAAATELAYGRVEVGKNGSQPSLGFVGKMKTERGKGGVGATGAAKTGKATANATQNKSAVLIPKNVA
jgi:hypothetical protein